MRIRNRPARPGGSLLGRAAQHLLARLTPGRQGGRDVPGDTSKRRTAPTVTVEVPPSSLSEITLPVPGPAITQGRYEIVGVLGEGGFKRVYLAHDARLNRDVALAVIKAGALESGGRARIQREAEAMARLGDHPNLVTVYDMGEAGDDLYIVSQYMAGGALNERLAAAPDARLPLTEAVRIAQDLCLALAEAHGHDILHRDVKPSNVWFHANGRAALGDFGLALSTAASRLTQTGYLVGTLAYMAPEIFQGEKPSAQSDLYGLGVLLYEMVAGRPPHQGETTVEMMHAHVHAVPAAPSTVNPEVPPALDALILRLLAKRPAERYDGAPAVHAALAAVFEAPADQLLRAPPSRDPFVGREAEWDRALPVVRAALGGRGKVLLLVGEPGIGKTRLATELGATAERLGARVLWGRAYEGEGAPAFWPWVQVLRGYLRDTPVDRLRAELGDGAPHVAQLVSDVRTRLPDLGERPPVEGADAQFLLFDAITQGLKRAAAGQPLVLVLEDLHWADTSSLLLLQFLARELADAPLLIVGTYRDVEVGQAHPLAPVLGQLAREPVSERLHLAGLDQRAVGALVEVSGIETPDAAHLTAQVYAHTEGNPFFVKATLRHLAESGVVDVGALGIPEAVRDVIRARLARLPAADTELLTVAAVVGREFDLPELAAVTAREPDAVLPLLDHAQQLGLVEAASDRFGHYWFTHALIRETLYDDLGTTRRLRLHEQVGDALEALHTGNLEPYLAQLSHHFAQAAQAGGDVDKAIDYAVRTAERAAAQLAYAEAAVQYERAIELLGRREPRDDRRRCDLLLALSYLYFWLGDPARHEATCLRTLDLARDLPDPETFAEALWVLQDRYAALGLSAETLFALVQDGLALVPEGDSAPRAQLLSTLCLWTRYGPGAVEWRLPLSAEAVAMARRVGDPIALGRALHSRVDLIWVLPPAERIALAREMIDLARSLPENPYALTLRGNALLYLFDAQLTQGNVAEADACVAALNAQLAEAPQRTLRYYATMMQVIRAYLAGRFEDAERLAQDAYGHGQDVVPALALPLFATVLFRLRWLQGRLPEIADMLLAAVEQASDLPAAVSSAALLQFELGNETEARTAFERFACRDFTDLPWDVTTGGHLVNLCELAYGLRDATRARLLYDVLLSHTDEVVVSFLNASMGAMAHWLALLATTLERWEDAEAHFEAALETNERIGARPFLARTQGAYAKMLLARGIAADRDRARELLTQAAATAEALGMAPLLAESRAALEELEALPAPGRG